MALEIINGKMIGGSIIHASELPCSDPQNVNISNTQAGLNYAIKNVGIEMTKAEYDALTDAQKNDGTRRLVKNVGSTGEFTAKNLKYEGDVDSNNVEGAIDKLSENIAKYKSKGNSTKGVYFDANGNVLETNNIPSVSNVLNSTSTTDALSANQGKVLKDLIDTLTLSPTFVSKSGTISRATELTINTHKATKNIPIAYVNMTFSVITDGKVNVYAKRSDGKTILEKSVNGDAWQNGATSVDLSFITSLSNGQYVTLYAYTWDNSSAVNWSAGISTNIS